MNVHQVINKEIELDTLTFIRGRQVGTRARGEPAVKVEAPKTDQLRHSLYMG